MPSFFNFNDRRGGEIVTVRSVQNYRSKASTRFYWGRCDDKNATNQQCMEKRDCGKSFTAMFQLLCVLMVLAMAPTVVRAEERDHERGHDNDLTGA